MNWAYHRLSGSDADLEKPTFTKCPALIDLIPATWQNGRIRTVLLSVIAFAVALMLAIGATSVRRNLQKRNRPGGDSHLHYWPS